MVRSTKPLSMRYVLTFLAFAGVALLALGLGVGLGTVSGAAPPPPGAAKASPDNSTPQTLPFTQTWSNIGLITANDDWSSVPGVQGFLGDTGGTTAAIDPQTIITPEVSLTIDVIANQSNPTITNGGVAEFEITDPVVALQGSGTADHPNLVIYLNTTGASNINVAYNVRDIDPSADDAVQQVALQYRVGSTGNFTNLPGGFVADATTAGAATLVTPVNVTLPAAADNQPQVQVRIITSNAPGSDEWVGVDDINITAGGPTATPGGPTNTTAPSNTATSISTPSSTITPGGPTNTAIASATPISGSVRIRDIQGLSHVSPLSGTTVSNVYGIVTAKRSNGFYMQDPLPDSNPGTSEGIFVFGSAAAGVVQVGNAAYVSGTVTDFRPGCTPSCAPSSSAFDNLTISQIAAPNAASVITASTTVTITPVIIGTGGRVPPNMIIEDDATGNVEDSGVFDPATDGIDFYESLEFMLVQVNNAVVVGPTTDFGTGAGNREIYVVGDRGANATPRTNRGGVIITSSDFNPERIIINDQLLPLPQVSVSDTFNLPIIGVYDYSFAKYLLYPIQPVSVTTGTLTREVAATPQAGHLTVGTFNVENLDPGDPPSKFADLASEIVNNMRSPDILTLEEVQDNDGPTNSTVVSAELTYNTLISYTVAAGGPTYQFTQVNPVDDQDGGEPGGNIRVGFFYRTDRGLSFVSRPGGGPTTPNTVVNESGVPRLQFSPGRIDPANAAFNNSRKPLAAEFMYNGRKLFLIGNHWNSKGGDDPLFGRFQPPILNSEAQRAQQAQIVNNFVDSILAVDPNSYVVVLGDLNDFEFSRPLRILRGTEGGGAEVLKPLVETLPQAERYTYVFQGNSQAIDHIFVSNGLFSTLSGYDIVHVNAEFYDQISDHDPQVAYFNLAGGTPTVSATPLITSTATASATRTLTATLTATRTITATLTATRTITGTATAATPPATATQGPRRNVLLIPDWTGDRVMAFDPQTGDLINANLIPSDPTNLASPKNAIMSASGNSILVADQIRDAVQEYSLTGTFIRTFTQGATIDNLRGIALRPNGNLLVTIGGGTYDNSVIEYDTNGNFTGPFIPAGSGGLSDPFDVYVRANDILVSGAVSDQIHRYTLTGTFLSNLAAVNNWPQQINEVAPGGNLLVANFSGTQNGVVEFTNAGVLVGTYGPITGNRGVYQLGNGNILTTDDAGVYEINRSGVLVSTKMTGVNAQYIELGSVPSGGGTTTVVPTATRTVTAVVSNTSTTTAVASSTATRTTQPVVTPSATRTTQATAIVTTQPTNTATSVVANTATRTSVATSVATSAATNTATRTSAPTSVVTNTVVATATVCTLRFTDVPPGHTFYANVLCLACRGIIGGYQCGGAGEPCNANNDPYFRPNNDITRGQISKIVSESAGFNENPGSQIFEDVAPGSTFYNWINRLSLRGLIGGYQCGTIPTEPCITPGNRPYFRPNLNATRGQLSKIVSSAAGFSEPVSGQFYADVPSTNPFYEWIMRLTSRGVMGGYPCNSVPGEPCDAQNRPYFRWANPVTRGQASKIVANTFFPACNQPLTER